MRLCLSKSGRIGAGLWFLVIAVARGANAADANTTNATAPNAATTGANGKAKKAARGAPTLDNFEEVDDAGNPIGWTLTDKQHMSVAEENGNHFLRLTNDNLQATVILEERLRFNRAWKSVKVRVRMRTKNLQIGPQPWQCARLGFIFEKRDGERIGDYPDTPKLTTDSDWVICETMAPVPDGATIINLQPTLMNATGTLDIDDIQIIGNPPLSTHTIRPGFPEGTFETLDAQGNPDGWHLTDPHIKVEMEGANHFLRLTNQNPQSGVFVASYFKLDPTWKYITLQVRERATNIKAGTLPWENARFGYIFTNAAGVRLDGWPATPEQRKDTQGWITYQIKALVPPGTVYIKLTPILHNTTGTLDIDDINIEQATL